MWRHRFFALQSYVLMLYSTLSRSQFDFTLPQVSFTSSGYHKHVTLTFNPTVRHSSGVLCAAIHSNYLCRAARLFICFEVYCCRFRIETRRVFGVFGDCVWSCVFSQRKVPDQDVAQGSYVALPLTLLLLLAAYNHEKVREKKTVLLITLLIFVY